MGFIDDVVKGVNTGIKQVGEGINKVQNKSQEMFHNANQQNRLTSLEAKKQVALNHLGRLVYDKYEKGDEVGDDVLKRKTTEIAEIEKEMELIKAELDAFKEENDPNAPQSKKSAREAGYTPTPGFACPHCGEPANQEKLFCAYCGGELKTCKKENAESKAESKSEPDES